jgi:hypothetical protein
VKRHAAAAKRFFQKAFRSPGHPRPRVINVDRNPSYPRAHGRTKTRRRTRTTLSMPPRTLPEQHRRAGSPSDQTAGESQSGIPVLPFRGAHDLGYRDGERDPEGTGHMVGEGRHRWASRVYYTPLRSYHRRLKARANHLSCSGFQVCNTSLTDGYKP